MMKARCGWVVLWFLLLASSPGVARAEPLTLAEAVARALENNPGIQALQESAASEQSTVGARKLSRYGEVVLNGGITYNGDEVLFRPMTKELTGRGLPGLPFDDAYLFWSLQYHLPLYTGGALKQGIAGARSGRDARKNELAHTVTTITYQVTEAYLGLLSIQEQVRAWQAYREALTSLREHIRLGVQQGKFAEVDLLKVAYDLQDVDLKLEELEKEHVTGLASLEALMGEAEGPLKPYELIPVEVEPILDTHLPETELLVETALRNRHDLKAARHEADAQQRRVKLARAERLPHVAIDARLNGADGLNIDYDDQYWSVTANLSFPLFDFGKRKQEVRRAMHAASAAERHVTALDAEVRRQVFSAVAALRRARKAVETREAALALAREVKRIEQLKYESGRGDIDDLLRAEARARLSEAELVRARYGLILAGKNLRKTIEGEL